MIRGNYIEREIEGEKYFINIENMSKIFSQIPDDFDENYNPKFSERKINYFVLFITNNCNMRCSYCFEKGNTNGKQMTFSTLEAIIEFINESTWVDNEICIRFFGGEPLLRISFIEKAIEKITQELPNKKIKFNIFTNGTIYSNKVLKLLEKYDMTLFISYDGNKILQDKNRGFGNETISNEIVSKNINKYTSFFPLKVAIRSVIDFNDIEYLNDCINNIISLGAKQISITLPWKVKYSENEIQNFLFKAESVLNKFYDELFDDIINHEYNKTAIQPLTPLIYKFLDDNSKIDDRACGAGRELMAIGSNGDIYPCHAFLGEEKFLTGNICQNKFVEDNILASCNCNTSDQCKNCDIKYCCSTVCKADNYYISGNLNTPPLYKCKIRKYIFDKCILLTQRLKNYPSEKRLLILMRKKNTIERYA